MKDKPYYPEEIRAKHRCFGCEEKQKELTVAEEENREWQEQIADLCIESAAEGIKLAVAEEKIGRLREFARHVIDVECWAVDGADIQDKAEELGLIVPYMPTKEDIDKGYEVGDPMFKFSETLQEPEGDTSCPSQ